MAAPRATKAAPSTRRRRLSSSSRSLSALPARRGTMSSEAAKVVPESLLKKAKREEQWAKAKVAPESLLMKAKREELCAAEKTKAKVVPESLLKKAKREALWAAEKIKIKAAAEEKKKSTENIQKEPEKNGGSSEPSPPLRLRQTSIQTTSENH